MAPDCIKVYFRPCAAKSSSALKKSTEREKVNVKIQLKGEAIGKSGGPASEWVTEKFS